MDLVLPARVRKGIYLGLALLGIVSGAIPVGYQAVGADLPGWYLAGAAVFSFVVAAPFTLAVLNTRPGDPYLTATVEPADLAPAEAEEDPAVEEADPALEPDPAAPAA
jgi:hypothetical protein